MTLWIKELETVNFRNIIDSRIQFGSGLNWLYGSNGQGKTNCLEAIYFSMTGKSFRTHLNREVLCNRKMGGRLRARVVKVGGTWEFGIEFAGGKATRLLDGKPCKSLDFFKSGAVIAFTARAKNLVNGTPQDRRQFLDSMIACMEPEFILLLGRYRKIRNQVRQSLHSRVELAVYRGFKKILCPVAFAIVCKRHSFLEQVAQEACEIYGRVFQGEGELMLLYKLSNGQLGKNYENHMMEISARELLYGKSMMGPHLDDLDIKIKEHKARRFASSGQVRAIVLSTQLAVREAYFRRFGHYPLMLLDDIDAELDSQRLDGLLSYLLGRGQTLISTSKCDTMRPHLEDHLYAVEAGRISPKEM